jgi:hypothetical protein
MGLLGGRVGAPELELVGQDFQSQFADHVEVLALLRNEGESVVNRSGGMRASNVRSPSDFAWRFSNWYARPVIAESRFAG